MSVQRLEQIRADHYMGASGKEYASDELDARSWSTVIASRLTVACRTLYSAQPPTMTKWLEFARSYAIGTRVERGEHGSDYLGSAAGLRIRGILIS